MLETTSLTCEQKRTNPFHGRCKNNTVAVMVRSYKVASRPNAESVDSHMIVLKSPVYGSGCITTLLQLSVSTHLSGEMHGSPERWILRSAA